MIKKTIAMITAVTTLCACSNSQKDTTDNPLLHRSTLLLQAPEFDKISISDYMPAFEVGMKEQLQKIDSIVNNKQTPTFTNTIVALEKSGEVLDRVSNIFFAISSANATDSIRDIEDKVTPLLSAHNDAITLNEKLFDRIKYVYNNEIDSLKGEDKRLLEIVYQRFVMNGAELNKENKDKLKDINSQIASLETTLGNKISDGTNAAAVLVDSEQELSGLDSASIAKAKELAKEAGEDGKYLITITNTTQQPIMSSLDNRDLRKKILEASMNRCCLSDSNDTRQDTRKVMALRLEKAKLLGYDCYADWILQDQMSGNASRVIDLIQSIVPSYSPKAKKVANTLQAFARETQGNSFNLEAYDWSYYAAKYKKTKFDINENEVREYFVLDSVLKNGVFYAANKLYGLTFKQMPELPVYAQDVHAYEVFDKDGQPLALFYTDYFHRSTKRGGAWMSNFVNQSKLFNNKPVIYNVCNFTKPVDGEPALLSFDDVTTMFHEFGHALHGLFASQTYPTLSGTNVPRDFVEMPSQFNEHWALDEDVLQHYAKNYKSGKVISKELIDKLIKSYQFDQAYALGENLAAVTLDIAWHTLKNEDMPKVNEFETKALTDAGLNNAQIPPRYRTTYFRHILSGGYSSGYYSYLWTEVLDDNIYQWFMRNGGMTRENGERFRNLILSQGYSKDLNEIFTEMTGLEKPNTDDLLESRGLK